MSLTVKKTTQQFHIGDEIYTVQFVKRLPKDTIGECDYYKKEIRILDSLPKKELLKTLIHELLHAVCEEHHLKLKHWQIYHLENPIYEFIRDNF